MLLGWHYSDYYANAYASNQYLASRGFVVLSINYRLGIGYGYEFHRPPSGGAQGASEYLDVKAAGEYLRTLPQVDGARIGIYGGSYGGFLTAMALARNSDLFSAGVDIHGVHDWTAERVGRDARPQQRYEQAGPSTPADRTRRRTGLDVVAGGLGGRLAVARAADPRRRRPQRALQPDGGPGAAPGGQRACRSRRS